MGAHYIHDPTATYTDETISFTTTPDDVRRRVVETTAGYRHDTVLSGDDTTGVETVGSVRYNPADHQTLREMELRRLKEAYAAEVRASAYSYSAGEAERYDCVEAIRVNPTVGKYELRVDENGRSRIVQISK